ncbi:cytochrome P450 [Aspergillus pseudoustus]|uniref:Cytochrome P450 n=1 Tax=Aspergillus pseudoustus TaxID=1810923 RepID=A0ABR4JUN2_9EURO
MITNAQHLSWAASPTLVAATVLVCTLTLVVPAAKAVSWVIYCLLLSPLRSYPGPFLAKLSPLWVVMQCRSGRRSQAVNDLHKKYGDFVRIAPNHISIADPKAVQQIYGHKTGFLKGPFYEDKDPKIHQRKKKIVSPAFSAKGLQAFEPHMNKDIRKLIDLINNRVQTSEGWTSLDFNQYSNFLAFDAIGDFAFGESFGFLDRGEDYLNLIDAVDARGEALNALGHLPRLVREFLKKFPLDPFWSQGMRGTQALAALGTKAYYTRRDQATSRKDLLSLLFNATDPDTGNALDEKEIIAESISFIVGGSDTTSTSMTNVVDIVSRNEAIQRRLQEELDAAFAGQMSSNWVPDFKTIEILPVLNAIVRETMRFRPTSATGLERVTPKNGKVVAGRFLPEGTLVSVPTLNVHHSSREFQDADTFNYERWLAEDSGKLLESFVPFSVGPRACIGQNFAWMEMFKTLAALFKLFHIERVPVGGTQLREGFFVKAKECHVTLRRR